MCLLNYGRNYTLEQPTMLLIRESLVARCNSTLIAGPPPSKGYTGLVLTTVVQCLFLFIAFMIGTYIGYGLFYVVLPILFDKLDGIIGRWKINFFKIIHKFLSVVEVVIRSWISFILRDPLVLKTVHVDHLFILFLFLFVTLKYTPKV